MISEVVARVAQRTILEREERRPPPHWGDFVVAEGLLDVWEASGDGRYLDGARAIIDPAIERGVEWGGRMVAAWAGLGLPALRLYRATESERYREYGLAIVDRARHRTTTVSSGGIANIDDLPQLWIDLVHFICPTFCEAALISGDESYHDAAVAQFRAHADELLDEQTGLFYHVWDEARGERFPELWSRGMGWATIAAAEMLMRLPESHPDREYLAGVLQRQVESICELQDGSGFWHTVIDRPDSYLETSTAAIFGLGIVRGIRLGVLDRRYMRNVADGWRALQDKVSHDGFVFGVSTGTPPGDFDHYQSITRGVETYGTGLFLQLGVEMNRL